MRQKDFIEKANQFGDFYIYYQKIGGKGTTYMVATTDFSTPYVARKLENLRKPRTLAPDEVMVYSWTSDKFRVVSLPKVKRMSPLGAVLKNRR
jgi:hypothetical protein